MFYLIFAALSVGILLYYLSYTIIHPLSPQQFPANSFVRYPLSLLIFPVEIFSLMFSLYFVYVLVMQYRDEEAPEALAKKERIAVAVLLPVYNEPKNIVDRTLKACSRLEWPGKINLYILDDSTSDEDKKNMDDLAAKYGAKIVRRKDRRGYKAGNINNAVKNFINEDYFVVLDSDQAPEPEFLTEMMDHFSEENVGFVQSPQHFINKSSHLERAVKAGTDIFYRAQCYSKALDGAVPFCGTNVVVRRSAFEKVKGFAYYTSTEDIDLGIRMNDAGYHGAYVPKILAKGYAPTDFKAYSSQQYRWANGNMAILRENWLKLLFGKFSMKYKIHMFFTLAWWLIGIVTMLYMVVPIASLIFGLGTHHSWVSNFFFVFLGLHLVFGLGMIFVSLNGRVSGDRISIKDALLQYSLITNSLFIYARAAFNALILRKYVGFVRTNKQKQATGLSLIKWNLFFAGAFFLLSLYAVYFAMRASGADELRQYLPISLWLLFYSLVLGSSIFFVSNDEKKKVREVAR